jgi:hypothetical protein
VSELALAGGKRRTERVPCSPALESCSLKLARLTVGCVLTHASNMAATPYATSVAVGAWGLMWLRGKILRIVIFSTGKPAATKGRSGAGRAQLECCVILG